MNSGFQFQDPHSEPLPAAACHPPVLPHAPAQLPHCNGSGQCSVPRVTLRTGLCHPGTAHPPSSWPLQTHSLPTRCPAPPFLSPGPAYHFCCWFCPALFFPLHSVPWETLKGYVLPPRDAAGMGPAGTWDLRKPASTEGGDGSRGGRTWHYLLIYLFLSSCPAPHPPSCCTPPGKMKNGLRQCKTRPATWPPQFNFL